MSTIPIYTPLQPADNFVSATKDVDKRVVEAKTAAMCSLLLTMRLSDAQKAFTFSEELYEKLNPQIVSTPFASIFGHLDSRERYGRQ